MYKGSKHLPNNNVKFINIPNNELKTIKIYDSTLGPINNSDFDLAQLSGSNWKAVPKQKRCKEYQLVNTKPESRDLLKSDMVKDKLEWKRQRTATKELRNNNNIIVKKRMKAIFSVILNNTDCYSKMQPYDDHTKF